MVPFLVYWVTPRKQTFIAVLSPRVTAVTLLLCPSFIVYRDGRCVLSQQSWTAEKGDPAVCVLVVGFEHIDFKYRNTDNEKLYWMLCW